MRRGLEAKRGTLVANYLAKRDELLAEILPEVCNHVGNALVHMAALIPLMELSGLSFALYMDSVLIVAGHYSVVVEGNKH